MWKRAGQSKEEEQSRIRGGEGRGRKNMLKVFVFPVFSSQILSLKVSLRHNFITILDTMQGVTEPCCSAASDRHSFLLSQSNCLHGSVQVLFNLSWYKFSYCQPTSTIVETLAYKHTKSLCVVQLYNLFGHRVTYFHLQWNVQRGLKPLV